MNRYETDRKFGCFIKVMFVWAMLSIMAPSIAVKVAAIAFLFGVPAFLIYKAVQLMRERRWEREHGRRDRSENYREERDENFRNAYGEAYGEAYGAKYREGYAENYRGSSAGEDEPEEHGPRYEAITAAIMRLLGHVAAANAEMSWELSSSVDYVMSKFDEAYRKMFVKAFHEGRAADYTVYDDIKVVDAEVTEHDEKVIIVSFFVYIAAADSNLTAEEKRRIEVIAFALGVTAGELNDLFREFGFYYEKSADDDRYSGYRRAGAGGAADDPLRRAMNLLGVGEDTEPAEITRAYRKLIRKYHPDLIKVKGLPDSMREVYEKRTKEINEAYDLVKSARNF